MKKTYIQPGTHLVSIKTVNMIATSIVYGTAIGGGETVNSDGRRHDDDLWEDEE